MHSRSFPISLQNRKILQTSQKVVLKKKQIKSESKKSPSNKAMSKEAAEYIKIQQQVSLRRRNDIYNNKLENVIKSYTDYDRLSLANKKKFFEEIKYCLSNAGNIDKLSKMNKLLQMTIFFLKIDKRLFDDGIINSGDSEKAVVDLMQTISSSQTLKDIRMAQGGIGTFFIRLSCIEDCLSPKYRYEAFDNFLNKIEKDPYIKNNLQFNSLNLQYKGHRLLDILNSNKNYDVKELLANMLLDSLPLVKGKDKNLSQMEFLLKNNSSEEYKSKDYKNFFHNFIQRLNENRDTISITTENLKSLRLKMLEKFQKCLISNQYLMMQKMLNVDDLSKYTSFEFNIIMGMDNIIEGENPQIEPKTKEQIMKKIFSKDLYKELEESTKEMSDEEKNNKLKSIQHDMVSEMIKNGCNKKIKALKECFNMFDEEYSNIMQGKGLEKLAKNRTVELCFAKKQAIGTFFKKYNIISILCDDPSWTRLEYILNNDKNHFQLTMVHELTHYTQALLSVISPKEFSLSEQGIKARELFNLPYYHNIENEELYYLHANEMGARTTEILTQLEKVCGLDYGTFCFQEEGTDEARKAQAYKIVKELDKYFQEKKGMSLAQFLNTSQEVYDDKDIKHKTYGFTRLFNLFPLNFQNNGYKMAKYDKYLELTKEQLSGPNANEAIEKCFEHLLTFIIPRCDMKVIAENLDYSDLSYIQSEANIVIGKKLQEQIDICEAQIKLYSGLLDSLATQTNELELPSLDTISSQIKSLEEDIDVKKYNELKNKLQKPAELSEITENLESLKKESKQLKKNSKVAQYLKLKELESESKQVELKQKMLQYINSNDIESLSEIISENEELLSNIAGFKNTYDAIKQIIKEFKEHDNVIEMDIEAKEQYIKDKGLIVQNKKATLQNIIKLKSLIKILKSATQNDVDVDLSLDLDLDVDVYDRTIFIKIFEINNKDDYNLLNIKKAINEELLVLTRRNYIVYKKNQTPKTKIDYFNTLLLKCEQYPEIQNSLNEYIKMAQMIPPEDESKLYDNVLKAFNDAYSQSMKITNETISKRPEFINLLNTYLKLCNYRLNNIYTSIDDDIENYLSSFQTIHRGKIEIYKFAKITLQKLQENIPNLVPNILNSRYNFELKRNSNIYSGTEALNDSKFTTSFNKLLEQLESLPNAIRSELSFYSNWTDANWKRFNNTNCLEKLLR